MRTLKILGLLSLIVSSIAIAQGYIEQLNVDNIRLDANTISTTDANGHLVITPNGTGLLEYTPGTASTVPYLDANKRIVSSAVTPTELGYLTGVTSAIQTQIDAKLTNPLTTNGDLLTRTAGVPARIAIGGANTVLQSSGTAAQWASTLAGLTLTSPTVNTPSIDVMTLDGQGSTPANPSAGFYKVYVKDATGKPVILNSSGAESSLGGGGGSSGINFLAEQNPGAEDGTTGWTNTGSGTFTTTTTAADVGYGTRAFSWDASAATEYATPDQVDIAPALYGGNCLAQFYYKGFDSNITIQVHDGSNVVASQALTAATNYTPFQLNFVCPSSGQLQLRFLAGADAAIGYFDEVHLGSALNISNVSQSSLVVSGYFDTTASCTAWTRGNVALGGFATDTDCPAPTSENNPGPGTLSSTDHNLPKFGLDNLPPGVYKIMMQFPYGQGSSTDAVFAINDGTTTAGGGFNRQGAAIGIVTATFTYTTAGNRTFELYAASSSATTLTIDLSANLKKVYFTVERFPLASQQTLTAGTSAMSWSGYHDKTCSWARTNTAYGDPTADATCTFTQNSNQNFGTVASVLSAGNKLPGVEWTASAARKYLTCATFAFQAGTSVEAGLQIIDQSGNSLNELKMEHVSGDEEQFTLCGLAQGITGTNYVKMQTKSASGSSTINSSALNYVSWTIVAIDQQMPAPHIVNSVVNPRSGVTQVVSAYITNSGTPTVTSQDGSWISSLTDNGAGDMTLNIAAGTFSATPRCVCTAHSAAGAESMCVQDTTTAQSSTAIRIRTATSGGTDFDQPLNVICVGAK